MFKQTFKFIFLTVCNLSLLLNINPRVLADYQPDPNQQPASSSTDSGASRGCAEYKIPLSVLAPKKYIGETTSEHPTFVWFLSKPHQVDFRIFKFDSQGIPQRIGKPILLENKSGINKYSLPKSEPGLTVGQKYLWQVAVKCSDDDYLIERAEFIVQNMPSNLSQQLSGVVDHVQKAELYAQAGFWYNALEEALNLPTNSQRQQLISSLLQDLIKYEQPDARQNLDSVKVQEMQMRINNLKQIMAIEDSKG